MKKTLLVLALFGIVAQGFAQTVEDELNKELDSLYAQQNGGKQLVSESTQVVDVQEAKPVGTPVVTTQSQPVYIIQQAPQTQVQKQPVTHIESSPLKKSRADELREQRQDVELQTELKIVEKLEQSRMEDEKRRSEVLFGDKFNQMQNNTQQAQTLPVQQPAQPVQPIVIQQVKEEKEEVSVREEVRAALDDYNAEGDTRIYESRSYFGGHVGVGDYDATNMKGDYAVGVTFGTKFKDKFIIEGSYTYAKYQIEKVYNSGYTYVNGYSYYPYNSGYNLYPEFVDMEQHTLGATVKYQILSGMIRPLIGATGSYSYRNYTSSNSYISDSANTNSFDIGVVAGMDFEFDTEYAVGLDFKYMWNLSNRAGSGTYQDSFVNPMLGGKKPEEISHYIVALTARTNF